MVQVVEAQVDVADALRLLGHRGQSLDGSLDATIERAAAAVNELRPRATWRTFPIESVDESGVTLAGVTLAGAPFVLPGSHIACHLRDASDAVLMAVTLGADSERLLKRRACLSASDGLIADASASSLVEEAADGVSRMIAEEAAARGLRSGKRFSPGYGDFPLAAQRAFLQAIEAEKLLGIRLTDGDLMVPAKSITAVVPLFQAATDSAASGTPCDSDDSMDEVA